VGATDGKAALPADGWAAEDVPWDPWTPGQAAERLAEVQVPWYVAGGWALDVFRGAPSREHEDLEIAIPAAGFPAIRAALDDLDFDVPHDGRLWPLTSENVDSSHQTWGRDRATGRYRIDVFREPHDGDTWICRRDESIRRPYDQLIQHSADGIPYLPPEIVLLFKGKASRPKDQDDFIGILPLLSAVQRGWLAGALERVHPGHRWLAEL
jgi:hypothetical protein